MRSTLSSFPGPLSDGRPVFVGSDALTSTSGGIFAGSSHNGGTLLQSIDHLGLLASTKVGPLSFAAGVVNQNEILHSSPDINSEKSYLGKIGFTPNDQAQAQGH